MLSLLPGTTDGLTALSSTLGLRWSFESLCWTFKLRVPTLLPTCQNQKIATCQIQKITKRQIALPNLPNPPANLTASIWHTNCYTYKRHRRINLTFHTPKSDTFVLLRTQGFFRQPRAQLHSKFLRCVVSALLPRSLSLLSLNFHGSSSAFI